MMTFATAPSADGLAQFISRPVIGSHDMRQFVKTCLFAFTDTRPVVRSNLHLTLTSVSATASPATRNGDRIDVCRERSLEPLRLLDGMEVSRATPVIYCLPILHKYRAS
jgi:hypothetical protein